MMPVMVSTLSQLRVDNPLIGAQGEVWRRALRVTGSRGEGDVWCSLSGTKQMLRLLCLGKPKYLAKYSGFIIHLTIHPILTQLK